MKKILCFSLVLILLCGCLVACGEKDENLQLVDLADHETDYVLIQVKDHGSIVVALYPETAPITVANFKKLVSDGFYDGLIFHRVIKDFMIQGGDPKGNGTGGAKEEITGEFSANGIENNLSHKRGVISMARSNDPNSASSQFFICHADSLHLDGNYAAFGKVIYGMETVDSIANVKTSSLNNKPYTDVVISSIRFVTLKGEEPARESLEAPAPKEDLNLKRVTIVEEETNYVILQVKDHGSIVLELYPDVAPITVANFKKLVGDGFYDGLTFHRVISGFVIQGGDPKGDGTGGSSETIKGEFSENGVANSLSHKRGVVSMARNSVSMDSASSQFFICHADCSQNLDGKYAAFGEVVYGMEIVDSIASVSTNYLNDKPTKNVVITSANFVTLNEVQ